MERRIDQKSKEANKVAHCIAKEGLQERINLSAGHGYDCSGRNLWWPIEVGWIPWGTESSDLLKDSFGEEVI
ncbi:hypothetical protein J1N35_043972 [Gossypium stocksii]|uniref:Uncharacterized protein n=1 Tax=Gossypium stocksii TaxID=47602 RepID=A0A9D3U889_9ROSI|nr:hypothetical protein J1N35_043972 [Gossypium stocksii]